MPIYEYHCNKCKNNFEVLQKISDSPVASCTICDSEDTKRLISLASFSLKGSGWYMTDYNKPGKKDTSKPEAKDNKSKKETTKPKNKTKDNKPTAAA